MSNSRRKFTQEFKIEAVKLITEGRRRVSEVARDLDISATVLRCWKRELEVDPEQAFPGKGKLKARDEEIASLKRENARLRMERDFLKKAAALFSKEPK